MLPVQQAEQIIFNSVEPLNPERDIEIVDLLEASGRILAQEITSQLDFPHWDNSAMDGYAVRHTDIAECNAKNPAILEIITEIPAGKSPEKSIQPGQAARIFTGAMMPKGADTVVMQEVTQREGNFVTILSASAPQAFVRQKGSYSKAGTPLLSPGINIGATEIAVLASAQCTQIPVYRRPVVAILSTGDELVTPEQTLKPGQLVDSNQYALATLVKQAGAVPQMLGIIPDDPEQLKNAISQALTSADIVISSGGVSVGDYDFVDRILSSLGGEIQIRAIAIKPGKPLTFAKFNLSKDRSPVLYFGLPGNPVSSLVTFWRFVQPAIEKLAGIQDFWQPKFVQAKTRHSLKSDGKRESYLWGQLHLVNGEYEFSLAGGTQNSGNLINLAQTNGLGVLPVGETLVNAGDFVQVLQVKNS
ncbi:molybdopterin molybdenumtransferase [[Phormidium ambiguum] IAM M-71]|uniref:Molybdopterin molybdenumtransferase n=1 Tax=[Phormidium ambiguum] IAM M-71 TaxID=454136 RepID=A0A1U7IG36_9CYAN|nr:gephyrin-like molybdotransferase Glp [Phormidium ambiguum]OKH35970.1 molybdopterin molybdenumtransferase [Phormidium ambiguum IAM M-71]